MTALEIVKRANAPDPFKIIELMRLTNEMLIDVPAYECNNGVINVALQRVINEMGEHRIYNQGVGKVATQTKIVQDRIAMLAAYAEVDAEMVEQSGNVNAARQSEIVAISKGMGLTQAQTLIYGDENKAEEFAGLMSRYNDLSNPNVVDAGGRSAANDMTSVYIVAVGQDLFHLIYPKGSKSVGVTREDNGRVHVQDPNNPEKKYPVYQDYLKVNYGLTIKAPDAVQRICNIPKNMSGADLIDIILERRRKMPKGATTYAMYSNADILIKLDKAARDKGNVVYTAADPWGKEITHLRDIRCRQMDVILNTEGQVA
jgi:hypothetical protein